MKFVEAEVAAVRNTAGLLEMSPMTKFYVRGPVAAGWLDRILTQPAESRKNFAQPSL